MSHLESLRFGYVAVFFLAGIGCSLGGLRARRIDHRDTRRGLVGLLAISGVWALVQGARLLAPPTALTVGLRLLGLVVGLASVGAWLYFCSAYTGQSYHRQPLYRTLAVVVFLAISAVKITNPIHGLYYSIWYISEPFPHLVIRPTLLHWGVAGLAYVLSAVGFYMLFQLFDETEYDTTQLGVLVSLAALPAIATIVGYAGPGPLIQLDYEPLGVAAFAIGVLYVADESFRVVRSHGRYQVLDELDEAVFLLDDDNRIRDYNATARDLFPALAPTVEGESLESFLPAIASAIEGTQRVIEHADGDQQTYLAVTEATLSLGPHDVGRAIILTDVTETIHQREELARHEEQLDEFTNALTHELRNGVGILRGQLDMIDRELDDDAVTESIESARSATDRMIRVIDDLVTLSQHGGIVTDPGECDFKTVVTAAWNQVDTSELSVTFHGDGIIEADRKRLETLFTQAFRFADANGASEIDIRLKTSGFAVESDGETIPSLRAEDLFEHGTAVPDAERGGMLPTVRTLARMHGWSVSVDPTYRDGVRYRVTDVPVEPTGIATE